MAAVEVRTAHVQTSDWERSAPLDDDDPRFGEIGWKRSQASLSDLWGR